MVAGRAHRRGGRGRPRARLPRGPGPAGRGGPAGGAGGWGVAGWWKEDDMAVTTSGPVAMKVTEVRRQPGEGERPEKTAILLTEEAGERRLGIWVGGFEGLQIAV